MPPRPIRRYGTLVSDAIAREKALIMSRFRRGSAGSPKPPRLPPGARDALRVIESHVRPDFRRTVVFGAIALAALIVGHEIGGVHAKAAHTRLAVYGCGVLVALFGVAASQTASREVRRAVQHRAGDAAATPLRIIVLLAGYLVTAFSILDLLDVNVEHLLVGGAVTGIIVGLAAQPILGNLFAGLVLLFARPYVPGEYVRVLSGAINGPHEGVIVSSSLLYTVLQTPGGPLNIPNSTLLAAAVGPTIPAPPEDAEPASDAPPDEPIGPD